MTVNLDQSTPPDSRYDPSQDFSTESSGLMNLQPEQSQQRRTKRPRVTKACRTCRK
jgi:hypothetical protein